MGKQSKAKTSNPKKPRNPRSDSPSKIKRSDGLFPWDRLSKESDRAWTLFQVYRDMQYHEGRRSGPEVAKRSGISRQMVERYMTTNKWTARAAEYDKWVDQQYTQPAAGAQKVHIIEEQLKAARALRSVGLQMLKQASDALKPTFDEKGRRNEPLLTPKDFISVMEKLISASVRIERDAVGMVSTPTVETEGGDLIVNNTLNQTAVIILPTRNEDGE